MKARPSTVIIGAGMAGLSCARRLAAGGQAVSILEASDRVGGRLGSRLVDGVCCDLGFQVSMSNYSALESLVPRSIVPRHAFVSGAVVWDGQRHLRVIDPRRKPWAALKPLRRGLIGWSDLRAVIRCRQWAGRIARGDHQDGTGMEVLERAGFQRRFIESFLRPFFGGVFLDETLSVSADRFLRVMHRFAHGSAELPHGGMQQLAEAMAAPIDGCITFGCEVDSIEPGKGVRDTDGHLHEARQIVLATPWDVTACLLGREDLVASSNWSGTAAVHFRSSQPVTREPLIHLNGSGRGSLNLVFSPSSVAPGYLADGTHSVLASLRPYRGQPSKIHPSQIQDEAGEILGVSSADWEFVEAIGVPRSLPDGDLDRLQENLPSDVWLAGDWMDDPSIETAVQSGLNVAELIGDTPANP
jgi:phytoene dehydrogenase-like protein